MQLQKEIKLSRTFQNNLKLKRKAIMNIIGNMFRYFLQQICVIDFAKKLLHGQKYQNIKNKIHI